MIRTQIAASAALAAAVALHLASASAQDAKPEKVDVRADARFKDLKAEVEKHKGKVVLVDFWATWCDPCVAMFPHLIDLHNKHFGDGLRVVTVSIDDEEKLADVKKFLANRKAFVPTLVCYEYGNEFKKVRDEWFPAAKEYSGGVPVTLVIGRDGKVSAAFVTRDDLPIKKLAAEIDAAVDKALKAK